VVYGYADTMLKHGRDAYGPQKTGIFLSALDRQTLTPMTNRPVLKGVGSGAGADPLHDQNLLRLLSTLTDLSAKPHYRAAADAELKWFLENAHGGKNRYTPWDGHLLWHVLQDEFVVISTAGDFSRPWLLWDRCFALAPEASQRFALLTTNATDSPRKDGYCIRSWAAAFTHTRDDQFLRRIDALVRRYEDPSRSNDRLSALLSLAIDCEGAAQRVPEPLASRLRAVADRVDDQFCSFSHDVATHRGFLISAAKDGGVDSEPRTLAWRASTGSDTTAQVGMMCVSRYDNSAHVGYRDLILAAADSYLDSLPDENEDAWPGTFGHAISLELAAWRHSANWKYMERARQLGSVAVEKILGHECFAAGQLEGRSLRNHHRRGYACPCFARTAFANPPHHRRALPG